MRLFSAIEVPADIADVLARSGGGLHTARWIDPADYHVTLAFFGEIDADVANDLAEELAAIEAPPVDIRLTELGFFGTASPHAIVALVERDAGLLALEARHRAIMMRLGIGDTARKFTPHVTLARLRRTPASEVAEWLSDRPALPKFSWRAERFALFSAATSRGGGPYVAEAVFPLGETGA